MWDQHLLILHWLKWKGCTIKTFGKWICCTKISVAKFLRGDTARVSGSLSCTSNRGWLRVFIQLQNRKTRGVGFRTGPHVAPYQCEITHGQILYMQVASNLSLTTLAVLPAARPLYPCPLHPPSRFCYCSGCFAWPRGQRVWRSLSDRCSSGKARRRHPPLAPWCAVEAAWPPGPAQRTGSCPTTTPYGCPGTAALRGRHRQGGGTVEMALFEFTRWQVYWSACLKKCSLPFCRGFNSRWRLSAMVSGSSCSSCSNKPISSSLGLQVCRKTTSDP